MKSVKSTLFVCSIAIAIFMVIVTGVAIAGNSASVAEYGTTTISECDPANQAAFEAGFSISPTHGPSGTMVTVIEPTGGLAIITIDGVQTNTVTGAPGTMHTVTASYVDQNGCDYTASATFTIDAASIDDNTDDQPVDNGNNPGTPNKTDTPATTSVVKVPASSTLPNTGWEMAPYALIGSVLLGSGGYLAFGRRR